MCSSAKKRQGSTCAQAHVVTQTICWTAIFFIASCAASSAYLTVSEVFPLEIRAMAISIFYAAGTLAGGVGAPALFGVLIGTGSRTYVYYGYLLGSYFNADRSRN